MQLKYFTYQIAYVLIEKYLCEYYYELIVWIFKKLFQNLLQNKVQQRRRLDNKMECTFYNWF